ncbi:hypothetical protein N500_0508 [Wolbachia pipientis wUni]|nr:hypothetical protein N500_0508 [Wolbachia pipientis wUni]
MRQNNGRKSFCIIDAQSIKNADTAEAMMQARRFQGRICSRYASMQFIQQQQR